VNACVTKGWSAAQRTLLVVSAAWKSLAAASVVLISVYLLKRMYSQAGAEDLQWILAPSCWLVSTLGGIELASGSGAGFISHQHRMVVGPACAGVNFLIVAILALYLSFQGVFVTFRRKMVWLLQCLCVAYLATILSNGCRILLAAHLYSLDIYGGGLTPERLHRLAGTLIYCASLFALCAVVSRWLTPATARSERNRSWATRAIPVACYLGVAVGVPLLNRAYQQHPGRFVEHCVMVILVCGLVATLTTLARVVADRLCSGAKHG
jgi:exosortase K